MLAVLSLMALIGRDLYARRHGEAAYANAQAINGGYVHPRVLDDRDAEDDQLRADELDAGVIWAQAHRAKTAADCPTDSHVFFDGCVAAMNRAKP
jgi:hypothetical protein